MKLRCTSCHAQLVQGTHLTVHETNCFICHYFKAGAKGEEDCLSCAVGGCTSCHIEPKGDINVKGWNFNHRKYIARGVACESATQHSSRGCPRSRREVRRVPQRTGSSNHQISSERLHKNHVTDHKIECSSCHTALRHEIGQTRRCPPKRLLVIFAMGKDPIWVPEDLYRGEAESESLSHPASCLRQMSIVLPVTGDVRRVMQLSIPQSTRKRPSREHALIVTVQALMRA